MSAILDCDLCERWYDTGDHGHVCNTRDRLDVLEREHERWGPVVAAAVRFVDDPGQVHGDRIGDLILAVRTMQDDAFGMSAPGQSEDT